MNDINDNINELLNDLKQQRDELELKLKLAKLEANEEWLKLESKLENLEAKVQEIGNATVEASEDVGAAVKMLGEEILEGFKKIAKHF